MVRHSYASSRRSLGAGTRALSRRLLSIGSLSRQGVIASSVWLRSHPLPSRSQRVLWLLPASMMIGFGVAFLSAADLGVAPFDVLLSALADRTPLSFGQSGWLVSGSLLAVAAALGERPRLVGMTFVVLNGFTIDLAFQLVVAPVGIVSRVGLALVGAVTLVAGVAVVVHTSATGGPFEAMMVALQRRGHRPQTVRTMMEVTMLTVGIAAGGQFGPMTVVIALCMGPAIATGLQALDDHRVGRLLRREGHLTESLRQTQPTS